MIIKNSGLLMGLALTACANIPDQTSEAYRSAYCVFDPNTFQEYPPGSQGHTLCMELWESGFDPDEDFADGDAGDVD